MDENRLQDVYTILPCWPIVYVINLDECRTYITYETPTISNNFAGSDTRNGKEVITHLSITLTENSTLNNTPVGIRINSICRGALGADGVGGDGVASLDGQNMIKKNGTIVNTTFG